MEIIGNSRAKAELSSILKTSSPPRVLAVTGLPGLGKFSYVSGVLSEILSPNDIISPSSSISEIKESLSISRFMPLDGDYRAVIIDNIHLLSLPAQDACLKNFEETSGHTSFIIICPDLNLLTPALSSRVRKEVRWLPLLDEEMGEFVKQHTLDKFALKICDRRPSLYLTICGNKKLANLYSILREAIISPFSSLVDPIPPAISDCKKSSVSYREAVAHVCAKSAKDLSSDSKLYGRISKILSFSSSLITIPSISVDVHWSSLMTELSL
jgi:hypothetical protein